MRRLRGRVQPPRLTGTFLHTAAHRRLTLFDLIIRNGTVIDGTRADRYPADVGLRADRITAIGDLGNTQSQHSIDAQGKIVAPGFVDVHNHSDGWLLQQSNFLPKTLQGFTTEVLMADGISYAPVDAATRAHWLYYMRALNGLMQSHYQAGKASPITCNSSTAAPRKTPSPTSPTPTCEPWPAAGIAASPTTCRWRRFSPGSRAAWPKARSAFRLDSTTSPNALPPPTNSSKPAPPWPPNKAST